VPEGAQGELYQSEIIFLEAIFILFYLLVTVLVVFFFFFLETGAHYVAQAGFKHTILLPYPPKCWDSRSFTVEGRFLLAPKARHCFVLL
jgi:hypothetical protein